ncbi:hypothetical protein [Pseudanabaena sp. ABRG5-3]|uniref:hypothetical protein n=1 Tax=Pseudanabaena sp. ABRG5-3 TaxID=685565 RepID=UPI000F83A422|nr:hypothetical protein [Pseudanabaena sp. ABRG5-3]
MTQDVELSSSKTSYPITSIPKPEPTASPTLTELKQELILCQHCLRTASNGIKCQGICVADSNY